MDVDIYEDEVIIYLNRIILNKLKSQRQINKTVSTYKNTDYGTSTNTGDTLNLSLNYNGDDVSDKEHYDDVMDALDVAHGILYYLFELDGDIETAKKEWDYWKILNTYEYYDEMRSEYE